MRLARPGLPRRRIAVGGVGLSLALATVAAVAALAASADASLSLAGTKAFEMARASDEAAAASGDDGERTLAQVRALTASKPEAESLKTFQEEAAAAHQALVGYRKQAQVSATEALQILAEATRAAAITSPDPVRREVLEQRALLAAHEAAVMAARARGEAERLRALLTEARLLMSADRGVAPRGSVGPAPPPPVPGAGEGSGRDVVVPNLIGARLDAAVRDLAAAGLRLGGTMGPREGFVVKQVPEAGARVSRQAPVSVTLSAAAATTTVPSP